MLCVECGTEVERLIGGSCPECFVRITPLMTLPLVVKIELCAHCGSRKQGAHWYDPGESPEDWVREETVRGSALVHERVDNPVVYTEGRQLDERTFQYEVEMRGSVEGVPLSEKGTVRLRRVKSVCERCSRMAGGFFAATIQFRATDRDVRPDELERAHKIVAKDLERQLDSGNRAAFLSKDNPMHGGHDYFIGDIDAARNVSRILKDRFGATVNEAAKLVGRKEGEDVYRVTFLVRIHLYSAGDIAEYDHKPYAIMAVNKGGKLSVMDLEDHRRDRLHEDRIKRLGGPELLLQAVKVSVDDSGVQVLDPASFRTETVLVPPGEDIGETIPVLRYEDRLYWAPDPTRATNNS